MDATSSTEDPVTTADSAPDSAPGATTTEERPASPAAVPLTVSGEALSQILGILASEDDPDSLALHVEVTGTSGVEYAYDLAFDDKSTATGDDLVYQQGELTVIIPRASVDALWGATLDLPSTAGQSGLVIRNPNRPDPIGAMEVELSGTIDERITQLLDQQINPSLAAHGGFASLVEVIDDSKAVILMGGGCQGCAVSAMTLREGIEKAILNFIPEIVEVIDHTDHSAGENPYYQ